MNPDIKFWGSEEVVIPYISPVDNKGHRYFCDLIMQFTNGTVLLVEIKPYEQTIPPVTGNKKRKTIISEALTWEVNKAKWSAAIEYSKKRGWHFQIWTEKSLTAQGILNG